MVDSALPFGSKGKATFFVAFRATNELITVNIWATKWSVKCLDMVPEQIGLCQANSVPFGIHDAYVFFPIVHCSTFANVLGKLHWRQVHYHKKFGPLVIQSCKEYNKILRIYLAKRAVVVRG